MKLVGFLRGVVCVCVCVIVRGDVRVCEVGRVIVCVRGVAEMFVCVIMYVIVWGGCVCGAACVFVFDNVCNCVGMHKSMRCWCVCVRDTHTHTHTHRSISYVCNSTQLHTLSHTNTY